MRVCHIVSGDLWAGAEAMACQLMKGLGKRSDVELSAVLLNEGKLAERVRAAGIPVVVMDERKMSPARIALALGATFRLRPPDVVHSHRYKENLVAFLARLAGGRASRRARLIATQHGMAETVGGSARLKYRIISRINRYLLSRRFYRAVVVSDDIRDTLVREYSFNEKQVEVIRNGIDIAGIAGRAGGATRATHGAHGSGGKAERVFTIGSSGRIVPVKGYSLMVEAAGIVCSRTAGIRFELAGDGPLMPEIEELIGRRGLGDAFALRGFLNDVGSFYRGLDLYMNTSHHEGIPMSILEAMAHGLPVVAPKVGGIKEIIRDGVEGYLLDGRDPEDIADRCLALYRDRALRDRMAEAARERVVSEFSVERMVDRYYRLYSAREFPVGV